MTIIVCDDDKRDSKMVRTQIERFGAEQSLEMHVIEMNDLKFVAEVMTIAEKNRIDAIFLDIDMPYISGEQIARTLSARYSSIRIIFYTNRDELVYDMIRYKPYRFIRKQHPEEIMDTLSALTRYVMAEGQILIERGKNDQMTVPVTDVRFVEVVRHHIVYHMADTKVEARGSIAKCGNALTELGFIRVHVAYMVNIRKIRTVRKSDILLSDGTVIPIGGSYKEDMLKNYKRMLERIGYD